MSESAQAATTTADVCWGDLPLAAVVVEVSHRNGSNWTMPTTVFEVLAKFSRAFGPVLDTTGPARQLLALNVGGPMLQFLNRRLQSAGERTFTGQTLSAFRRLLASERGHPHFDRPSPPDNHNVPQSRPMDPAEVPQLPSGTGTHSDMMRVLVSAGPDEPYHMAHMYIGTRWTSNRIEILFDVPTTMTMFGRRNTIQRFGTKHFALRRGCVRWGRGLENEWVVNTVIGDRSIDHDVDVGSSPRSGRLGRAREESPEAGRERQPASVGERECDNAEHSDADSSNSSPEHDDSSVAAAVETA